MDQPSRKKPKKTRIQGERKKLILDSALDIFATYGFHGATIDQIALKAKISKPNLLYYFHSKELIYRALLDRTMEGWLDPLIDLDANGDPITELTRYIAVKMDMSFANPLASRLFAIEIQSGAEQFRDVLATSLKLIVEEKAAVIRHWMNLGKLRPVDPFHLIFSIWSVTQHYADFAAQIEILLGRDYDREEAKQAVTDILLRGLRV
jgi:TetR/AcrR family transcriptional regulator